MHRPTVLVVDPNPATLRRVREALAATGLLVQSARDAREAEDTAEGVELALVLSAASLPRGNGYDLARALRERQPQAGILLMTGGFEVYNQSRALEAGVTGHVTKPFSPTRLRKLVEDTIGPLDDLPRIEDESEPADRGNGTDEIPPMSRAVPRGRYTPLSSDERVATIIPRNYQDVPIVQVDPSAVGPEIEKAIMEVLPEVVEAVVRQALSASPAFRDLVAASVEDAVRARVPDIAREVAQHSLSVDGASATDDSD